MNTAKKINELPDEVYVKIADSLIPKELVNAVAALEIAKRVNGTPESMNLFVVPGMLKQIGPYLNGRDLSNINLVCKTWSRGVNDFLADQPMMQPFDPEAPRASAPTPEYTEIRGVRTEIQFQNVSAIEKFLEDHKEHVKSKRVAIPQKPVILHCNSRSVSTPDRSLAQFWNAFGRLLEAFGQEIWYLEIWADETTRLKCREFYDHVRDILMSTPNLRTLWVVGVIYATTMFDYKTELVYVRNNPLPQLPNLVWVDTAVKLRIEQGRIQGVPEPIYLSAPVDDAILRAYSKQTKKLVLGLHHNVETFNWPSDFPTRLPNLKELALYIPRWLFGKDFRVFDRPRFEGISKLTIGQQFTSLQLIEILGKMPNLLVLCIPELECEAAVFPRVSQVESLKGLQVKYCYGGDYSFFRIFPNLEYLELKKSGNCKGTHLPGSMWEKWGIEDDGKAWGVPGCRLWNEFTELREITLFEKCGTRGRERKRVFHRVTAA